MSRSTRRRVASRRGRPPIHREKEDRGTQELQLKRAAGITQEPVDQWLAQGRLSADMHHCALHFRWLYTLRFGSPSIKALNPGEYLGCEHRPCSSSWDQAREEEYRLAAAALESAHCLESVLEMTVFNRAPASVTSREKLLYGLSLLVSLWRHGR